MAPNTNRESVMMIKQNTGSRGSENKIIHENLPRLSMESLQRTISDISLELITIHALDTPANIPSDDRSDFLHQEYLPEEQEQEQEHESEEEEMARCECCGMGEECTREYVGRVRAQFTGRFVCGLCSEAVSEEMARSGSRRDEAVGTHMADCSRFNRLSRAYPCLFQAQAVKEILKKSNGNTSSSSARAKSLSPRSCVAKTSIVSNTSGLARSSSCIPAIRKDS